MEISIRLIQANNADVGITKSYNFPKWSYDATGVIMPLR
jgi:hypothetical protein